jgi:hypothetical protein
LADLAQIAQNTVIASELAYDVEESVDDDLRSHSRLPDEALQRELPGYEVAGTFVDTFTSFKAVAFESKTGDGMPIGFTQSPAPRFSRTRTFATGLRA